MIRAGRQSHHQKSVPAERPQHCQVTAATPPAKGLWADLAQVRDRSLIWY